MKLPVYRFGSYVLDAAARELCRDGERISMPQKTLDCLLYLVEHRDHAVSRTELVHAVWGRIHFSDAHLGKVMFQVRRAVGDTGDGQNMVLTVPRFGYRWIAATSIVNAVTAPAGVVAKTIAQPAMAPAPVVAEESVAVEAVPAQASPPVRPRDPGRKTRLPPVAAAVALTVLALAAGAGAHRYRHTPPPQPAEVAAPAGQARTLAVLPVAVDADPSWAWLRLGLMDLIGNDLRAAGLVVVPSDNVVAAIRAASADADTATARSAVRDSADASVLVEPQAWMTAEGWHVRLVSRARDGTVQQQVEAEAGDAIAAGEAAAVRLLDRFGIDAAAGPARIASDPSVERTQRIEAAFLADQLAEAGRLLDQAPPQLRDAPELRLRRARLAILSGHPAEVPSLLGDLAEHSTESEPELRARALIELGMASIHLERMAEAQTRYDHAIGLLDHTRQPRVLARAYLGRGVSYVARGENAAALADFARARVVFQSVGDRLGAASAEANEATADLDAGRYAQAIPTLARVAGQFRQFGAVASEVRAIGGAIRSDLALLQTREALAASERGGELLQQLEQPLARASLQSALASAQIAGGLWAQAQISIRETIAEIRRAGVGTMLAVYIGQQARIEMTLGRADAAARLAAEAAATADDAVHVASRAGAWLTLARALRALGRDQEAAKRVADMAAWAATIDDVHVLWRVELAQAEQAWAERHRETAFAHFEQAQTQARAAGSPAELLNVADAYGRALLADGELLRAAAVIGEVTRWSGQDYDAALLQLRLHHALGQIAPWQAALADARTLAGERMIPPELVVEPSASGRSRATRSGGVGFAGPAEANR